MMLLVFFVGIATGAALMFVTLYVMVMWEPAFRLIMRHKRREAPHE
ncbi:MAG: hypothetical protein WC683_04250 [bacterium]